MRIDQITPHIRQAARDAAVLRSQGISAPADRPSQRRCSEDPASGARVSVRMTGLQLRDETADGLIQFSGYASVTDTGYEMYDYYGPYTEMVTAGAFASSLARADLDVPLVLQHQDLRRIARTTNGSLKLSEDEHGLSVNATLDPTDVDVQYIVPKLRAGLLDEMSFKFRITSGEWSPNWDEYHIKDVDLHRGDVAIVGYGASPHTAGSGLRAKDLDSMLRELNPEQAREALAVLRSRAPKTGGDLITDEDVRLRLK